jgi:hypothetical protein
MRQAVQVTQPGSMQVVNYAYHIGGVFASCRLSSWEIIKANPALITGPDPTP